MIRVWNELPVMNGYRYRYRWNVCIYSVGDKVEII